MKRIGIKYIIILTSTALLVLVGLQLYHAKQLYNQKSEEFNTHIDNVLSKVAIRHEKASDLKRYSSFFNNDFSAQYKNALKQEFQNLVPVRESVSIRDTLIEEDGRETKYLYITGSSYDSLTDVTAKYSVLARDVSEIGSLIKLGKKKSSNNSEDSTDLAYELDKRVMTSLFKKSKYINEMMVNAFRSAEFLSPSQRINLSFLDSMIAKTFEYEKLDTKYNYAVLDENEEVVTFPSYTDKYNQNLDTSKTKTVRLFPGNIFEGKLSLHVYFPGRSGVLFNEMWLTLMVSILLVVLVVVSFYAMFRTILYQRKLAAVKSDFISNMTHEFKTPISTISLACEAMNDQDMTKEDLQSIKPYIKMIDEENKRLGGLVEQILKASVLNRGELRLKNEKLELNEIVTTAVRKAKIRVPAGKGQINLNQAPGMLYFEGDNVHTTNLVSNLIDNAIKYSKENIDITISTEKLNDCYKLVVEDKGVGIKSEHLDKIFDKLYRVPTGNIHNVKGFGLGLSYVKAIADLEDWKIKVKSKYGEGSTFTLIIDKLNKNE